MGSDIVASCLVNVAAGIVRDAAGRILLTRRRPGTHLAGTWEFPGGKLAPGESPEAGLVRELAEELGLGVERARPLLALTHEYPEKAVRLRLFEVERWRGKPCGREGQAMRWEMPQDMRALDMPAADRPIVRVLTLDAGYAITPDSSDTHVIKNAWRGMLRAGRRLLQFRAPALDDVTRIRLARRCGELARGAGACWLYNGSAREAEAVGADGVHVNARRLMSGIDDIGANGMLTAASCHNRAELKTAGGLGIDFVTLSPVRATPGHPDATPLNWKGLAALIQDSPVPVYALGGVGPDDLARARAVWAYGVAGVRAFID